MVKGCFGSPYLAVLRVTDAKTDVITRKVPIKVYRVAQKLSLKSCSKLALDLSDNF